MFRSLLVAGGLALTIIAPLANGHHGFAAHFDPDRLIRIEGTVKQFDYINPHGFLPAQLVKTAYQIFFSEVLN